MFHLASSTHHLWLIVIRNTNRIVNLAQSFKTLVLFHGFRAFRVVVEGDILVLPWAHGIRQSL